ncbi:hypothetical protein HOD75_01565 [archaeon]|nr:hypothetical protein [archaeon]MBT4241566.1 hypothetical protein [archaeon]MBT4417961.1 hypothetical protein [archaeon]
MKAQSQIIVTVLIILLVLVLVVVVWVVVQNMIERNAKNVDVDTFGLDAELNYYLADANTGVFDVKRGAGGGNISEVRLIFTLSNGSTITYLNDSDVPGELETSVYYIESSDLDLPNFLDVESVAVHYGYGEDGVTGELDSATEGSGPDADCVPLTNLDYDCGINPDGCGNNIDSEDCDDVDEICSTSGRCYTPSSGPGDPNDCTPNCGGKECGRDGCGGSCGSCAGAESCINGVCETCVTNCGENVCGFDGCGGSCGSCNAGEGCITGSCYIEINSCMDLNEDGRNYVLIEDVVVNESNCLRINADNIELDCKGYSITNGSSQTGIYSENDNIIIKNCNINMSVGYGIRLKSVDNGLIIDNNLTALSLTYGLYMIDVTNTEILNNKFNYTHYGAIYGRNSDFNTIRNNNIFGVSGSGIYLQSGSDDNNITSNTVESAINGIRLSSSRRNLIDSNIILNNYRGIFLSSSPFTTTTNNTLSGNYIGD